MLSARFLLHCVVKSPLACTWIGIVMWFVARSVWLKQMQYMVWSCSRSLRLRIGRGECQSGSQITGVVWWMTLSQWGISCGCLSAVGGLLEGDGGRRGLQLNPVQLGSILQIVTSAGSSVFDGQDVHVVMDFLLV